MSTARQPSKPTLNLYRINATIRLTICTSLLCALSLPAWSLINYTESQQNSIIELVEQLEDRHYAKQEYDDVLSSEHLDNYIDSLDSGKMYFTQADIADFEQYRTVMDDQLSEGKLDAGFTIFNRYHTLLQDRLEKVVDSLPEAVAAMDFSVDESFPLDIEGRLWAKNQEQLDDRWRKQLKNQVLSLRLSDKPREEIVPTLEKRFARQLKKR